MFHDAVGGPDSVNPYAAPLAGSEAAPTSELDYEYGAPLAERMTRLGAQILDNILYFALAVPGFIWFFSSHSESLAAGGEPLELYLYILPLPLLLACYQWYLVATTGQSLGKKWLGIRIVRLDGSLPGFLYGVVLRSWLIQLFASFCGVVGLVDTLMIFGRERRCLHDLLAGTRVIRA